MDLDSRDDGAGVVLLSMLEHWAYCPRQCLLIHIDDAYAENIYTLRGRHAHEAVDVERTKRARGLTIEYALPLWSDRLGLAGKADVVEFRDGVPYPVEHKIGKLSLHRSADLQLCAQGLCLEEMVGVHVPAGAIYHVSSRRRREVLFTADLRAAVEAAALEIRAALISSAVRPPAGGPECVGAPARPRAAAMPIGVPATPRDPPRQGSASFLRRCRHCSLRESCLPDLLAAPDRVRRLAARLFTVEALDEA